MGTFDYEKVKDVGFFRENRLDAHSDHITWASREEAERGETSSLRESLNGIWKFHYARTWDSVIPGFWSARYDCGTWDDIYVPAHMQMEGWDAPQYANVQYPWDGHDEIDPGEIPASFNPVGSYVKLFAVPKRMQGRPLFVSFQGVESAFALWLNGEYVGYSSDSFTPAEFDLTPYLRKGENKLALAVFKWSAGSWLEDQDFFRFSGIFRDVYLYTKTPHAIEDMKLQTELSGDYREGKLEITLKSHHGGTVKAEFFEAGILRSRTLAAARKRVGESSAVTGEEIKLTIPVAEPLLWSAEQPNLYVLELTVTGEDGRVEGFISEYVGFRRFEMDGGLMKLNGKRIVFRGVNRHEFSCDTGRVVTETDVVRDLTIMKQNNINAIRTCHYPDASILYRLADEFGFYLIGECNMETHGTWDAAFRGIKPQDYVIPGNHMEYQPLLIDRIRSMYERDKNHPSILIWSCGNESFGGDVIYEMSAELRRLDSTRLVHYEGIRTDRRRNETSDMESQMYTPVTKIEEFLAAHPEKPFICCEYTHAMGNSCGGMHKYTDLTDREPRYQGGFIWDFVDQSIREKDRYGREYQAYGGDHYERPTDYNFSGNGIVDGERGISPKMQEVKFNYQNLSVKADRESFTVTNKNLFTNSCEFDCLVTLLHNGKEIRRAYVETDVEPLSKKMYAVPFEIPGWPGEYVTTVSFLLKEDALWARRGHEIAFGQGVFAVGEQEAAGIFAGTSVEKPSVFDTAGQKTDTAAAFHLTRGIHNTGVRGQNFEVLFSDLHGGLISYKYAGREMIEAIPKPNFWRALTDNDCGNLLACRLGQWKLASLYSTTHNLKDPEADFHGGNPKVEELEHSVRVTYTYYLPMNLAAECRLSYEVYGDGRVKTALVCDPPAGLPDMPEISVLFKLNADYQFMDWYGSGPDDTYADRKRGGRLGIHHKTVKENVARYLVPQESGNHTDVRWMKVTDHRGRGMLFEAGGLEVNVSPYTPHELENAAHPYELPEAHYTVVRVGRQMGVAGDDSWGARTHEEYCISGKERQEISFTFQGI